MRLRRKYIPSPPLPERLTPSHSITGDALGNSGPLGTPANSPSRDPEPPSPEVDQEPTDTVEQSGQTSQDEEIQDVQDDIDRNSYSEESNNDEDRVPTVDMDIRTQPVHGAGKVFPSPNSYDEVSIRDNPDLYGMAPWFDRGALEAGGIVERYAFNGELPGGIPLNAVYKWAWVNQFAVNDNDLRLGYNRDVQRARREFAMRAMNGFDRLMTSVVPAADVSGAAVCRTYTEVGYIDALNEIPAATINGWRGRLTVSQDAYVWNKSMLMAEFRYLRKDSSYWVKSVADTRRFRSRLNRAVPYECLNMFGLHDGYFLNGFAELTPQWRKLEVPRGCNAELPMIFSYKMDELHDPQSGYWVVAYTEWVVKVAAFILFDVYDSYRLWALSPAMIEAIGQLNLDQALGNRENARELRRLVAVIENTRFSDFPAEWRARGSHASLDPGRQGPGADFIYYNPWTRSAVSRDDARDLAARERVIPDGHPMGWNFDAIPDGWDTPVAELPTGAQEAGAWDGDVPVEGSEGDEDVAMGYPVAPGTPAAMAQVGSSNAAVPAVDEAEVVRRFLRAVGGVPESILSGSYDMLVGYLQGRLFSH